MIGVIAATPPTSELHDVLHRQLERFAGAHIALTDGTTRATNGALRACHQDRMLLIDAHSLPVGDWHRASFPQRFGMLGGLVRTYAGTRAGFAFQRNAVATPLLRRQSVAWTALRSTEQHIDLPNEGGVLIRRSVLETVGYLEEALPLDLAIAELALRAREHGIEAGFDAGLALDREARFIEPTLDDEARFAALRCEQAWDRLLRGPAHRAELRSVAVIAHGSADERRLQQWYRLAGYPIAHSSFAGPNAARATIEEALRYRSRDIALIDLRAEPVQDWLLSLIEGGTGESSIGVATCGTQGRRGRLVAADAAATLIITDRIPAQICLREEMTTFDGVVEDLCIQASLLGVVTVSSEKPIARFNGFRERHLDAHSLEVLLRPRPQAPRISFILLAGSTTGVHRYTTDALRSHSGELAELFVVVRSDAPKITARLRNHLNVELVVDADDELANHALSRALGAVRGDIIVLMRDDYLVAEHWLSAMIAHLDRMPHVGIVVPRLSAVPGEQNCEDEMFADSVEFRLAAERRRQARAREAKLIDIVQMPSLVMRRAVVDKIGGFDEVMATSYCGMIDYSVRARTAGFQIALAEDVFVHHIPYEHTQLPHDRLMADPLYERAFAKKWGVQDGTAVGAASSLIGSPAALRHRFVATAVLEPEKAQPRFRDDEERVIFVLPLVSEEAWQDGGNLVRRYVTAFTANDRVTLAVGRDTAMRTSVVAQRIRRIIAESALDEALVPDIVIADAADRTAWLASLPAGPRHLLLADDALVHLPLLADCSPSGLRRAAAASPCNAAGECCS